MPETSSVLSTILIERHLVTVTNGQTDGHS